jgi:hypothetical protein
MDLISHFHQNMRCKNICNPCRVVRGRHKRARCATIEVARMAKKRQSVSIDGRLLGSTSQHLSIMAQISLSINRHFCFLGRTPATTDKMTLASFLMCEKGMDPL